jgi:hypothetical protein
MIFSIKNVQILNFRKFRVFQKFTVFRKLLQSLLRREQFCEIPTLWAYNFGTVRRKKSKISLKNPKFIRDSVKQIKKYVEK